MDGIGQYLCRTDDDADFLGPGDSCINEVSLEHHEMGHQQWCERNGIFRALQLVDGCEVGQGQLVELSPHIHKLRFEAEPKETIIVL